jgi:hypothetical protein
MTTTEDKSSKFTTLLQDRPPFIPESAEVMTLLVEVPPGGPGLPASALRSGVRLCARGRDNYQDANNLADAWSRFVVVMLCVPGQPMLTLVDADELESRRGRRGPRPR